MGGAEPQVWLQHLSDQGNFLYCQQFTEWLGYRSVHQWKPAVRMWAV